MTFSECRKACDNYREMMNTTRQKYQSSAHDFAMTPSARNFAVLEVRMRDYQSAWQDYRDSVGRLDEASKQEYGVHV